MTQRQGLFITLEGIDGAGKSSHIDALEALFRATGREVLRTREPGGTPLTESLLVFAARRDHVVNVIVPALARGAVVLCDRFTDATFAYQGAGRGFDLGVLGTLEAWVQGGQGGAPDVLQPALTLWFDLAPETAAERLAGARLPDRFEAQPVAFFRRVAEGYARRAGADAGRFERIDADTTRESVWAQVEAAVRRRGLL
jgi:dTMP kinase